MAKAISNVIDLPLGLVLAGGESQRMGSSKPLLELDGLPLWQRSAQLLAPFCSQVFISCRADQQQLFLPDYPVIIDQWPETGPMGALRSAWVAQPKQAWFVLACDLPLLGMDSLKRLLAERQPKTMATAFQNPEDQLPEPLAALWEAEGLKYLDAAAQQGRRSPRKVLMSHPHHLVSPDRPEELLNANTPAQWEEIQRLVQS